MKTLVKISLITLLLSNICMTMSCSKSDDVQPANTNTGTNNNGSNTSNDAKGSYTFKGSTFTSLGGEYLITDPDVYLFVQGSGVANYISMIFSKRNGVLPEGTYTYSADPFSNTYDPQTNFSGGAVTTDDNPLGYTINGGKVTVTKSGSMYNITFDVTVDDNGQSATAKGNYNGALKER